MFLTPLIGETAPSMGSVTIFRFSWGELPGKMEIIARYGGLISGRRSRGVCTRETAPITRIMSSIVIVATGRRTEMSGKFKNFASSQQPNFRSASQLYSDPPRLFSSCLFYNRVLCCSTLPFCKMFQSIVRQPAVSVPLQPTINSSVVIGSVFNQNKPVNKNYRALQAIED